MARLSNKLSAADSAALLTTLKTRFEQHMHRHRGIVWHNVQRRLEANAASLWKLQQMEATGGEPDVVGQEEATGEFLFYDCAAESPAGRRSLCFDKEAWLARKEAKPTGSAMELAETMEIEILTEAEYRYLQTLGYFDQKTSSWVQTPDDIRTLGGALFCDRRYNHVFVYHNGAQSYYAARGFRGVARV